MNWKHWFEEWEKQQGSYMPFREERFNFMLQCLKDTQPEDMVVLDLCCGNGAISKRILEQFPKARVIALDFNPILQRIGQETLGNANGRLHWVRADLKNSQWVAVLQALLEKIGEDKIDAVCSTTALHWLPLEALVTVYRGVAAVWTKT